jgi:hypothetical protein
MTVYPALPRALFGLGELRGTLPDEASIETDVDMTAIRRATGSLLLRRRDTNVAG